MRDRCMSLLVTLRISSTRVSDSSTNHVYVWGCSTTMCTWVGESSSKTHVYVVGDSSITHVNVGRVAQTFLQPMWTWGQGEDLPFFVQLVLSFFQKDNCDFLAESLNPHSGRCMLKITKYIFRRSLHPTVLSKSKYTNKNIKCH